MTKAKEEKVITKTPSGFSVVAREFKKDKGAFAAFNYTKCYLNFRSTFQYLHSCKWCIQHLL